MTKIADTKRAKQIVKLLNTYLKKIKKIEEQKNQLNKKIKS